MWTWAQALDVLTKCIKPIAEKNLWIVTVYGSVAFKGEGRDLDLILVRLGLGDLSTTPGLVVAEICRSLDGTITDVYLGMSDTVSYVVQLPNRQLLDLQFRTR